MRNKAFTLIELLIVVAIIAILAAIAVPNFLEAQTRSKVSRVKADLRTIATGLESYRIDNNAYPACHRFGVAIRVSDSEPLVLERLTTPIAYLTSITFRDPFLYQFRYSESSAQGATAPGVEPTQITAATDLAAELNTFIYQAFSPTERAQTTSDSFANAFEVDATAYILHSAGPDSSYYNLGGILANDGEDDLQFTINLIYNPTNGTVSPGSIWREGGQSADNSPDYAGGTGLLKAIRVGN